ncbi:MULTISPECIES: hydantoinase/oxoprolinase family protein [Chelativorans]|jgi:N-methylhydantoinase A|uniref:Hydantoinase/oxoprolinase n=1 Tax=Chelativorans sp. (strain BNC1) TaxID=266779 RepID=Q11F01_CHESB|nr:MULTISPECIES: hydantoinase/oxoprolinase family protein [Chelativorans]
MLRIGIDIGGTFTDFAIWDGHASGYTGVEIFKVPSTPGNFHLGVIEGLKLLLERGRITADQSIMIVHGTTVSTNAVIERSSPPVALLVTSGFRDILGMGRLRMNDPINLFDRRAEPLIPRNMVFEIEERMLQTGEVDIELNPVQLIRSARAALEAGARALAVCFLHSYRNPAHELAARDILVKKFEDVEVTLSHEIWSQPSEYERASAAVLNAYASLSMKGYLAELEGFLRQNLKNARLFISKSNGGVMASNEAGRMPIHTLLSGPAAGVTAACALGNLIEEPQLLTMDMGGTSTDISVVNKGQAVTSLQGKVGDFPLMMPVTAVEAIGAGGGSIAWVDGKVLHVGPRSAGAFPGPACYGLGGTQPTISDAYLLCGYLSPERPLAGRLSLSVDLAAKAMQPIADALGMDVVAAAEACITVATANMLASALPFISRLGVPPSELTLMSFGGAGAIHGALLADEIDIGRVVLPRMSSVFCAYGCLVSDLLFDVVESVQGRALDNEVVFQVYKGLEKDARAWLDEQVGGNFLPTVTLTYIADVRYKGQAFDVATEFSLEGDPLAAINAAFHVEHERLYGHSSPQLPIEILTLRLQIRGALERPRGAPLPLSPAKIEPKTRRKIRYGGKSYDAAIFDKAAMPIGFRTSGPAIIEQETITVLVPPAFDVTIGRYDDVILERRA